MDRAATERDLGQALEEEQFVVYYQPVVDVVEGRLLGLEAFVRWKHPERGLIEPDQFLPIAQGAGLMSEIGVRVLRETCAQLAVWKHTWPAAAELWVSVNLAEEQLLDGNLAHQVNDILSWTALSPSQLVIEVSEDTMSANIGQLDVLRQIKALGVRVTIDGYGAGRSSFSYVKELDMVSSLKIDRSFVIDLIGYRATSSAVRAMVATARELELELMVDGVEDPDQSDLLVALGLRVMQGYLFSEPVPPEVADHRGWFDEAVSPRWQVSQGHTLATLGAGKATSRASS
jgi:EAL domain-containing protein (putative c-di-GMP-specific phosphodiesterase class I)